MDTDRIKEIQQETAYPESVSVQQALLKVWNETVQEQLRIGAVMQSVLKENDLRIGNFIKVISSTKKFDSYITQAKGYDIVRIEEKSFTYWNYEPIILTEEWLLKFGYGKKHDIYYKNNSLLRFIGNEVFYSRGEIDDAEFQEYITSVKYVHELQNLHFALTGNELTVA